jgi:Domain of unknown function (DUF4369)/AhpC/TSA family
MKKNLLLLFAICFAGFAYAQQYTIKAHITGFPNGTKFYLKDVEVDSDIDSAVIQNDQFVLNGKLVQIPQSLWLCSQFAQKFYYATLMMGNDDILINGDIKNMPFDLAITGLKTQDDHNMLINLTKAGYKKRNELLEEYFALKGDSAKIKSKQIWKVIGKIDSTDEVIRKDFIKNHLNSYEALSELFYLKGKYPTDTLQQMYNSLQPEFKESIYAERIANYIKVGKILEKNDDLVDFTAVDKDGHQHHLSDIKGKYILLDFSTTYCGPCMASVADLRIVSKKYAEKLEIVTFSGDGGKATWLKGVARDNPTWLSLWDGKGNYGETISK